MNVVLNQIGCHIKNEKILCESMHHANAEKTDKSQRLSEVVAKFVGRTDDEISTIGTNGLLTQGAYTRTDEFTDSIVCAIATKYKKINNKEN